MMHEDIIVFCFFGVGVIGPVCAFPASFVCLCLCACAYVCALSVLFAFVCARVRVLVSVCVWRCGARARACEF